MAKFDKASLLSALCVTVIISPWMPLSQCVQPPTDTTPFETSADPEQLTKPPYPPLKTEPAEILPEKHVEPDSERSCSLKCETCRQSDYPPTSEEERQPKDEVSNIHGHDDTTPNKCRRMELKISKVEIFEERIVQWSSTVSMGNEETELMMLYLKEKLARIQEKSFNYEGTIEVTGPNPYSYVVCLNILNNMEEVSNEVYMKAIKAFKDPNFRMTFVRMPEIRRGPILELL